MPRTRTVLVVAVVVMLVVAGCSSGNDSKSSTGKTARTAAPPTTTRVSASVTTTPVTTPETTSPPPDLAAANVKLTRIASGLRSPDALTFAPDGRAYVLEQKGLIRRIDGGSVSDPVLDLQGRVGSDGNEQGLLGLAFSRDGSHLYVDYTDKNGDTNVDELAVDNGTIDAGSRRRVLFVKQPFANHNGGDLVIDEAGMLYITFGDGGSAGDPNGNGQNLGVLLGKILRIDPTPSGANAYSIPPDNPFVAHSGARGEIWMWGLRNPWRFSFDAQTGDTWIADVGQNLYEEIDFAPKGEAGINWGWNAREGLHPFRGAAPAGARDPIAELSHADGNCSITGGYVYRGKAIPDLQGAYIYGDFCAGELLALTQANGAVAQQKDLGVKVSQLTTFAQDAAGEIYAVSREGNVYRIDAA